MIPNMLRGKLVGSYTPGADVMSIHLTEPEIGPTLHKKCPGGGGIYSGYSIHDEPDFKQVLARPRRRSDGTFHSSMEATRHPTHPSRVSLTLRRAGK